MSMLLIENLYVLNTMPMNDLLCFCCWSGYDLEVSDQKIETISDDGEIEFLEEEDEDFEEEETYVAYPSGEYEDEGDIEEHEMNQSNAMYQPTSHTQSSAGSSAPLHRQPLRVSSKYSINSREIGRSQMLPSQPISFNKL